jgi:hypothetical protein
VVEGSSDAFNKKGRKELEKCLLLLPEHTRYSAERVPEQLDYLMRSFGLLFGKAIDGAPRRDLENARLARARKERYGGDSEQSRM